MAAKLPETLIDLSPWGWSGYATPEVAAEYALELGWNTEELDELKLVTPETKTYAFYYLADGRINTQLIRVKNGDNPGEYVDADS